MQTTKQPKPNNFFKEIQSLISILVIAMLIRTFVFELFYVPTGSMSNNIFQGDYIFSTKYNYGYSNYSLPFAPKIWQGRVMAKLPMRGDVIIMRPPHNMEERYIKRLIGLPGDKVQIIDDIIFINDQPIKRQRVGFSVNDQGEKFIKYLETLPNGRSYFAYKMLNLPAAVTRDHSNFGPYIVEENRYFFLGDNRDNSGDSRYQLGTVPFENFIAKGQGVIFSTGIQLWDGNETIIGQVKRLFVWLFSIRFNRVGNNLYENIDEKPSFNAKSAA